MKILAFETSAKAVSVALVCNGVLMAEYFQNSGQTHSRTLMKMAQDLLSNCDLTPNQMDAVACAVGPGSFTGIRIGVAAAKGFCWGADLPLCGISTLKAMAYGAAGQEGLICPVMDARRNQVYNALFESDAESLHRVCPDRAISLTDLEKDIKNYHKPIFLIGDGANLCYNMLKHENENVRLVPEHLRHQRASGVALAAQEDMLQGKAQDAAFVLPNYLRLPQAERERLARLNLTKGE